MVVNSVLKLFWLVVIVVLTAKLQVGLRLVRANEERGEVGHDSIRLTLLVFDLLVNALDLRLVLFGHLFHDVVKKHLVFVQHEQLKLVLLVNKDLLELSLLELCLYAFVLGDEVQSLQLHELQQLTLQTLKHLIILVTIQDVQVLLSMQVVPHLEAGKLLVLQSQFDDVTDL